MKKSIISLIVVLTVTTGLLAGCTIDFGSQDEYQNGNDGSRTVGCNEDTDISNGYENGSNENSDNTIYSENRGKGTSRNVNSQQIENGYGNCDLAATDEPSVASLLEPESNGTTVLVATNEYGAFGALTDKNLTLAEMLTYAVQDEYLARAEYVYIIETFGNVNPFGNIVNAEEQHISQLLPLFTAYGIEAPADTGSDHAVAVSSLTAAYQAGKTAEIDNIAMYNAFLKQDLPDDVRVVFENLREASERHLAAFRKHL
jgi:hypothetical protein